MISYMSKVIKIIAGPNGSGKTTFAEAFVVRAKSPIPFLNPDLIAAGLGPVLSNQASFQAGRVLLTEIKNKIENGESFAFESTLSGLTYAAILKTAKANGYKVVIYFIFLNKISLNISRIKKRVTLGGHDIPTNIVRRRHLKCFHNFWTIYKELSDEWTILDNSLNKPKFIQSLKSFNGSSSIEKNNFMKKFIKGAL